MVGPAYYPPADRTTQWFGNAYPGTAFSTVEKVVLHSTEGTGWPAYKSGASAPHLTVRGDFAQERLVWRQHLSLRRSARALRNATGGVQTNLDGAIQVEIVGTCDPSYRSATPHLRCFDLPDWAIDGIADFIIWCSTEHGVRLSAPAEWPRYPSSPSADKRVRMTGPEWNAFRGICGHMHVPENTHIDPGDFPISAVLARAKGSPVSKVDVISAFKENIALNTNGATPNVPTLSVVDHIQMTDDKLDKLLKMVAALSEMVARLDGQ